MKSEFMMALEELARSRDIPMEVLLETVENALITACRNQSGKGENFKADINREDGDINVYTELTVVGGVEDPAIEISVSDAKNEFGADIAEGDVVRRYIDTKKVGRILVQTARNIMSQGIRERENDMIYDYYSAREGTIVTGIVQRYAARNGNVLVGIGKAEALLAESEQIPGEIYRQNDRIKVVVQKVTREPQKRPRILVSRASKFLVARLFESEVTEIQQGIVEIKAIAREPGARTKMAVWSNDENVDPIGACVGMGSGRVNAVVDELNGEKIDIINWVDQSAEFIENALSPAKVICVLADDDEKTALVVVPDNQLSLAIGKVGQNAKLAARLTHYKIDIKSESQAIESGLFEEIGYIEDYDDDDYGTGYGPEEADFDAIYETEFDGREPDDEEYGNDGHDGADAAGQVTQDVAGQS